MFQAFIVLQVTHGRHHKLVDDLAKLIDQSTEEMRLKQIEDMDSQ